MGSLTQSAVISRDTFIQLCPPDLKTKIEDFLVHYNERKGARTEPKTFSGGKPGGSGFRKGGSGGGNFTGLTKRPGFAAAGGSRPRGEFDGFLTDFRAILSKVSDTNRPAIWTELSRFRIQRCFPGYVEPVAVANSDTTPKAAPKDDGGWKPAGGKRRDRVPVVAVSSNTSSQDRAIPCEEGSWKELVDALYLYTKNCSMYYRDYIDILVNLKGQTGVPGMTEFVQYFVELVLRDFAAVLTHTYSDETEAEEEKVGHRLLCNILGELFLTGCLPKKDLVSKAVLPMWSKVTGGIAKGEQPVHTLEVFLVLLNSSLKGIVRDKGFQGIHATMQEWVTKKTFSGKTHYAIMDTLDSVKGMM